MQVTYIYGSSCQIILRDIIISLSKFDTSHIQKRFKRKSASRKSFEWRLVLPEIKIELAMNPKKIGIKGLPTSTISMIAALIVEVNIAD